jgi:hypothetical protein
MKRNLIRIDNYLFAVGDKEFNKGSKVLHKQSIYIVKEDTGDYLQVEEFSHIGIRKNLCKKILSHRPLNGAPYLDGVDVLPSLNQEDEAEEIFPVGKHGAMHMPNREMINNALRQQAYNKAKEKYKFTEKQLDDAISWATTKAREGIITHWDIDNFIESLQQPKYPIAFECEVEPKFKHIGSTKEVKGSGSRIKNKHAGNPKTFINSEGRTEWVGKYIYE